VNDSLALWTSFLETVAAFESLAFEFVNFSFDLQLEEIILFATIITEILEAMEIICKLSPEMSQNQFEMYFRDVQRL